MTGRIMFSILFRSITVVFLLSSASFALDHFYAGRAGFGMSGLTGSDVPTGTKRGFAGSLAAIGAESFYPSGPLWGTEISISNFNVKHDTTVFNELTGQDDDSISYGESFGRVGLGLFLMKSWDLGVAISTGPQISYLGTCSRDIQAKSTSCLDDYKIFQFDAQVSLMVFIVEPLAIDLKYVQTLLPFDKNGEKQILHNYASLGLFYVF